MPVAAHSSSSSPYSRAYATIAASTPSTCLRSDSDSVHSQKRRQASSRVTSIGAQTYTSGQGRKSRPRNPPATMAFATLSAPSATPDRMAARMEKFVIEGGAPLSGSIVPAGNKNAALPALAACLLTEDRVLVRNVPRIRDVDAMIGLLNGLGVETKWLEDNAVELRAANVDPLAVDVSMADKIRASFLIAGPLLARFGRAEMPTPGGDVIGRRRLDPHLDAFRALGTEVTHDRSFGYRLNAPNGLKACDFFMDEPSVMATENALMAAALTPGSTVIHNAASEPHVQDLARMLLQMG